MNVPVKEFVYGSRGPKAGRPSYGAYLLAAQVESVSAPFSCAYPISLQTVGLGMFFPRAPCFLFLG